MCSNSCSELVSELNCSLLHWKIQQTHVRRPVSRYQFVLCLFWCLLCRDKTPQIDRKALKLARLRRSVTTNYKCSKMDRIWSSYTDIFAGPFDLACRWKQSSVNALICASVSEFMNVNMNGKTFRDYRILPAKKWCISPTARKQFTVLFGILNWYSFLI